MKDTALLSIHSDSNIGLYFSCTKNAIFIGIKLRKEQKEMAERILGKKIIQTGIAGTPYPGIFLIETEDSILAPSIIFENEKRIIERHSKKKVEAIDTPETALRNIVCLHEKKAVMGKGTDKSIKDHLKRKGYSIMEVKHQDFDNIGSLIMTGKNMGIIAPVFDEKTKRGIEEFFGIGLLETTVNNRGLFISSGIVHSEKGIIIGEDSMTVEVMDVTRALSE